VGLQLGRATGQGQVGARGGGVVAGPADVGRAEVADFLQSMHSRREGGFLLKVPMAHGPVGPSGLPGGDGGPVEGRVIWAGDQLLR
jgi:hypothetical protein